MNRYGYVKVAACIPSLNVADCHFNTTRIIENMRTAAAQGIRIIAFPELSITSYTCGDLFLQPTLLKQAEASLARIADASTDLKIVAIVGLPVVVGNAVYNCAAVVSQGEIIGIVPKCYTPNYSEFAEDRWFASGRDIESEYLEGFVSVEHSLEEINSSNLTALASASRYARMYGPHLLPQRNRH